MHLGITHSFIWGLVTEVKSSSWYNNDLPVPLATVQTKVRSLTLITVKFPEVSTYITVPRIVDTYLSVLFGAISELSAIKASWGSAIVKTYKKYHS